jgi:coenzyme F420-reducing hydrogenase beta subunit
MSVVVCQDNVSEWSDMSIVVCQDNVSEWSDMSVVVCQDNVSEWSDMSVVCQEHITPFRHIILIPTSLCYYSSIPHA